MDIFEIIDNVEVEEGQDVKEAIKDKLKGLNADVIINDREKPTHIAAEEVEKIKAAKEDADQVIQDLQEKLKDDAGASEEILEYKKRAEELEEQLQGIRTMSAIKDTIRTYKRQPHNIDDIIQNLNIDEVKIEDGEVQGLAEQYDQLVESKQYLFKPLAGGTDGPGNPGGGKGGEDAPSIGKKLAESVSNQFKNLDDAANKYFG